MSICLQEGEAERLATLYDHQILDTPPTEEFDDLVRLAAQLCGVPIAAISLIDKDRQWFKAITGLPISETTRDAAFCAHTILYPDVFVVPDALSDPRFQDNPLVTGDPRIRFYAGVPLVTDDGHALGSLCIIDRTPKSLTADQEATLRLRARQVSSQLRAVRRVAERERLVRDKENLAAEREQAQTELAQTHAALAGSNSRLLESEERLRRLTDAAFEGIAISQGGVLVDTNSAFAALFGYDSSTQMVGLDGVSLATPEARESVANKIATCDERPYEAVMRRRDGSTFQAELRGRLIQLAGRPARVTAVRDITQRRRQEDVLRHSQARLAEAQRVAQIGSWEYDIEADRITWSDELFRLFGIDPGQGTPSVEALMGRFHPDDVPMHIAVSNQAMKDGLPYEFDIRAPLPNGSLRWFHAVGRGESDKAGRVTRLFGTLMDITERKLAEERFRVLFEQSSDAHLLCGAEGIIDCNNATLGLLRCDDKAQVMSLHPSVMSPEFQPDGSRSDEKSPGMEALARQHGFHRFEWIHRDMDGEDFPVEITLTPVTLAGSPVLLAVLHDLTERKRQEQQIKDHAVILEYQKQELEKVNTELEALATIDGLTGLKNRRAFRERLAQEFTRSTRYDSPLSVILLDVDNFKLYNDAHGHPAGDEVLRQVGDILKFCARETDLAARYGGEEFVLILPQTDGVGAAVIAERIRESVAQTCWPRRAVTASLGVSSLSPDTDDKDDLVARADAALYQSKSAGRNRVTCDWSQSSGTNSRKGQASRT